MREVRIGIYRQDIEFINKQFEDYYRYSHQKDRLSRNEIFQQVCNNPFDQDWFRTLPQELYESGLWNILVDATLKLIPADEPFALLQKECSTQGGRCSD